MQKKISIFSFFSGIGILDLAFEKNGYNIVFVNEYDNLFIESYQYAMNLSRIASVTPFQISTLVLGYRRSRVKPSAYAVEITYSTRWERRHSSQE